MFLCVFIESRACVQTQKYCGPRDKAQDNQRQTHEKLRELHDIPGFGYPCLVRISLCCRPCGAQPVGLDWGLGIAALLCNLCDRASTGQIRCVHSPVNVEAYYCNRVLGHVHKDHIAGEGESYKVYFGVMTGLHPS